MTKDQIDAFAEEAGITLLREWDDEEYKKMFYDFAALVANAEREACAKVAESTVCGTIHNVTVWGLPVAAAIRQRGEK